MGAGGRYKLRIHGVGRAGTSTVFPQAVFALCDSTKTLRCLVPASRAGKFKNEKQTREKTMKIRRGPKMQYVLLFFGQHRTIPALRLKHRSGSCGTFNHFSYNYQRQYRIILSADTASEVRQMPSQKRR